MDSPLRVRVLLVALALLAACSGDDEATTTTTTTTGPTTTAAPPPTIAVDAVDVDPDPTFAIGERSGPYAVTYVVEDLLSSAQPQTGERLVVRPPFESVLDQATAPPPIDEVTARQVSVLDRLRIGGLDDPLVIHRIPGIAVSEIRVRPILDAAIDAGLLEVLGQREVAGRRCQVVRTATLLGAAELQPITEAEHADSCLDADGILLEEVLHLDGEAVLRRVAVEVDTEVEPVDGDFDAGTVIAPVDQGGGSVLPVSPDAGSLGPFWVLPDDSVPEGFELVGRFGVIPPQPERFSDESKGSPIAGTADVWRRGVDAIVVWQGGTQGRDRPYASIEHALEVDGGPLGDGELLLGATSTELRFAFDGGRFVHVIGSLPPDELAAVARAMIETEGTGLVYLDDRADDGGDP